MSRLSVLKEYLAYMDREEHRLDQAHRFLSAIPKGKRTKDDKRRLEAVGNEIHVTGTHFSMLRMLLVIDNAKAAKKRAKK